MPIIALTASVMQDEYERAKSVHFDGYLRKPVLRADLYNELKRFLPYGMIDISTEEPDHLKLTSDELKALPVALQRLEALRKNCEQIVRNNNIGEIEQFADTVLLIGQQRGISCIMAFAAKLRADIDCFDIISNSR